MFHIHRWYILDLDRKKEWTSSILQRFKWKTSTYKIWLQSFERLHLDTEIYLHNGKLHAKIYRNKNWLTTLPSHKVWTPKIIEI